MKSAIAIAVFLLALLSVTMADEATVASAAAVAPASAPSVPAVCMEKIVVGPCKAWFPRFAYYADEGACRQFIYGGCQGTNNNFLTEDACKSTCIVAPPASPAS